MRCYSHLSDDEREQIGVAKAVGHSIGAIAKAIGRPKSTVSRELLRNRLPSGRYSPLHAAGAYQLRRRRDALIERDRALRTFVVDRLAEGWTPEQISGWLKGGNEPRLRAVGCETIYAFIYRTAQQAEQLWRYLTRRHKRRRPRRSRPSRDTIKDRVSIRSSKLQKKIHRRVLDRILRFHPDPALLLRVGLSTSPVSSPVPSSIPGPASGRHSGRRAPSSCRRTRSPPSSPRFWGERYAIRLVDATHLSIHAREKYLAGKIFEWAGDVGVITINPGWFADNYMAALEPISQFGLMALPLGEGLNAPPSNEDAGKADRGAACSGTYCKRTLRQSSWRRADRAKKCWNKTVSDL